MLSNAVMAACYQPFIETIPDDFIPLKAAFASGVNTEMQRRMACPEDTEEHCMLTTGLWQDGEVATKIMVFFVPDSGEFIPTLIERHTALSFESDGNVGLVGTSVKTRNHVVNAEYTTTGDHIYHLLVKHRNLPDYPDIIDVQKLIRRSIVVCN